VSTSPVQPAPGPTPSDQLMQFATGYIASACVGVAAQLRIADLLDGGAKSVAELGRVSSANEDALYRVLRALAGVGIFVETAPRVFANTPTSEPMRTGTRDSIRDMVVWMSDTFHFRVYGELMHSVKTGENAVKKVTGFEAFDYFNHDRALGEVFNAAMTAFSARLIQAVLDAYDFSGLGTLADIAGGHGFLVTSILKKHPDLQGVLLDLPHVCPGATSRVESLGMVSRCRIVEGDFFKAVPAADSYVMKHIIHDWDDARAVQILKNCAAAMRGKGKVILIESVLSPGNEPHFAKWVDIEMLLMPSGRERTEEEFSALFSRAGLRLSRVLPTKSLVCVVEAVRA
jgi:hypothetical protein